jgi:hypothetical protein
MVDFADLREARVSGVSPAADAWEQLAGGSRKLGQRVVDDLAGPLRGAGWEGDAADAAAAQMTSLRGTFERYALLARNLSTVLRSAAVEFDRLQRNLQAAIDAAVSLGLTVHDDGRVSALPVNDPADAEAHRRALRNAEIYSDVIRSIVEDANESDLRFAGVLVRFLPDAGGDGLDPDEWGRASQAAHEAAELLGLTGDSIPKAGSDPADVATWWAGHTTAQRDLLLAAYPDRIGGLDGLPTLDRDRANRLWLRDQIGEGAGTHQQRLVSLLAKLEASDYAPPERRLYLLGLATEGDGKAIVAVGNPDAARHTAVIVPGVSTNLAGMAGEIDRAAAVQAAADQLTLGPDGDVAVVAWLGYHPPQMDASLVLAAGSDRAESAAAPLDAFVDGLRAAHGPGADHITAIGHSYGSVVVGNAASGDHHLAVDDIVTAGSPGMDVHRAAELNVGPRHVWAGAATDDPVASPESYLSDRWAPLGWPLGPAEVAGDIWALSHDIPPQAEAFGGNVYQVDTRGHGGYWDLDPQGLPTQSLLNQASVVVGQYQAVTLDRGAPPS